MNTVEKERWRLEKGLVELNITATPLQCQQLLDYAALLHKWNQHINLTAIRDPLTAISRHLLDSLSILPYLEGESVIDVGTGAGLPGIPLSILLPDKNFFLLDSNQKKQVFVSQVVKILKLSHVQCVHSRIETYQPEQKFSTILTRAVAPLTKLIPWVAHLWADGGVLLAMLGKESMPELPPGYVLDRTVSLYVPGEIAQRHVAIVRQVGIVE